MPPYHFSSILQPLILTKAVNDFDTYFIQGEWRAPYKRGHPRQGGRTRLSHAYGRCAKFGLGADSAGDKFLKYPGSQTTRAPQAKQRISRTCTGCRRVQQSPGKVELLLNMLCQAGYLQELNLLREHRCSGADPGGFAVRDSALLGPPVRLY